MKLSLKNVQRIYGSKINTEKSVEGLTYVTLHDDEYYVVEYVLDEENDKWYAYLIVNGNTITLNVFDEIEAVLNQIYYITGFYHGMRMKKL